MDGRKPDDDNGPKAFSYENTCFIEGIPNIEAVDEWNDYRFYHIKGIHSIRDLDADLDEGFTNLLNGCQADQVFSVKEGEERLRTMYFTKYVGQCFRFSRTDTFIEFQTTGHAFDYEDFIDTGRRY